MFKRPPEPMSSTSFREALLAEHEALRGLIAQTLALATTVAGAAPDLGELRGCARRLYLALEDHMAFEERMLPVALRDVIGWGQALAASIAEDHGRQRDEVAAALRSLEVDVLSWGELIEDLRAFTSHFLVDMEREEEGLLEADLDDASTDAVGG